MRWSKLPKQWRQKPYLLSGLFLGLLMLLALFIIAPGSIGLDDGDDGGDIGEPEDPENPASPPPTENPPGGSLTIPQSDYYDDETIIVYITAIETTGKITTLKLDDNIIATKLGEYANQPITISKNGLVEGYHSVGFYYETTLLDSGSFTYHVREPTTSEASVRIISPTSTTYVEGQSLYCYFEYSGWIGTPLIAINGIEQAQYYSGFSIMLGSTLAPGLKLYTENTLTVKLGTVASDSVKFDITEQDNAVSINIKTPNNGQEYNPQKLPSEIFVQWTATAEIFFLQSIYVTISGDQGTYLNVVLEKTKTNYTWVIPAALKGGWEGAIDIQIKAVDSKGYSGNDVHTIYFQEPQESLVPGFDLVMLLSAIFITVLVKRNFKNQWRNVTNEEMLQ